jgi:hypothetical protein
MTSEVVKRIKEKLKKELSPQAKKGSERQELVRSLIKEIVDYQERGFTLKQIYDVVQSENPESESMSFYTFKNYVANAKKDVLKVESLGRGRPRKKP